MKHYLAKIKRFNKKKTQLETKILIKRFIQKAGNNSPELDKDIKKLIKDLEVMLTK